jgi:hypothetical protein
MTKTIVEESVPYDNFLGKTTDPVEPEETSLADFLGMEDDEESEREKLWVGMPEFVQKDNPPFKTIYLHFRNQQDFDGFVSKYKSVDDEQTITKKTKSMWYPHLDKDENSLKRWFEM